MAKKYKIVYDLESCIGANKCMGIHPKLWGKDSDEKAILIGGKQNKETKKFELEIEEDKLNDYKESALICPVYVIDILDEESGKSVLNINPTKNAEKDNVPVVRAHYDSRKEWKMDPKGFFTIKPYPEEKMIRVRYYGEDHALKLVIEGENSEVLYNTIVREGLVSTFQHAAYIGNELLKAEIAMVKKLPYVQDDPI